MIVNVAGLGLIPVLCIWLLCETELAKHYLRPDSTSVWTYAAKVGGIIVCADCHLLVRNVSRVRRNAKHIHVAAAASAVPGGSGDSAKLAAYGGASAAFKGTISGR